MLTVLTIIYSFASVLTVLTIMNSLFIVFTVLTIMDSLFIVFTMFTMTSYLLPDLLQCGEFLGHFALGPDQLVHRLNLGVHMYCTGYHCTALYYIKLHFTTIH